MEQLLVLYSKKHAPKMPESYHQETVRQMLHMIELASKKERQL